MNALGWIVWVVVCFVFVVSLGFWTYRGKPHPFKIVFSLCLGAALAATLLRDHSKFHLCWVMPVALTACVSISAAIAWRKSRKAHPEIGVSLFQLVRHWFAAVNPPESEHVGETIELDPFGKLTWTKYDSWEGRARLPAWAGFQSRGGPYGSIDSDEPSDGTVEVGITPPDTDNDRAPSEAQRRAFQFQLDHGEAVVDSLLNALPKYYRDQREDWGFDVEQMPDVTDPQAFRKLIGLHQVHVHPQAKDGVSYIGLEFGCEWDDEHGFGVLLHGATILEMGRADAANDAPGDPDDA